PRGSSVNGPLNLAFTWRRRLTRSKATGKNCSKFSCSFLRTRLSSLRKERSNYRSAREPRTLRSIWKSPLRIQASVSGMKTRKLYLKTFASSTARPLVSTVAQDWASDSVGNLPLLSAEKFVLRAKLVSAVCSVYFCRLSCQSRERRWFSKRNPNYCNDCAHGLFVL